MFRQYMEVYRSHWRDDPQFDRTKTDRALPHLPCPEIDTAMLLRIAGYPVKQNFVLKRLEPVPGGTFSRTNTCARWPATTGQPRGHGRRRIVGLEVTGRLAASGTARRETASVVGLEHGFGDGRSGSILSELATHSHRWSRRDCRSSSRFAPAACDRGRRRQRSDVTRTSSGSFKNVVSQLLHWPAGRVPDLSRGRRLTRGTLRRRRSSAGRGT